MRTIVRWGTVIALLDILSAMAFWYVYRGTPPERILQSVAAGLLGRSAFELGLPAALLGALLHWLIACAIAGVFRAIVLRYPVLLRRPAFSGPAYGLGVYAVMTYIVVPLSAAAGATFNPLWIAYSILFSHMICVGYALAWMARRGNWHNG